MARAFDADATKSAIKFIYGESKVCRLCLGSTAPEEISIHDFINIQTPYYNDHITYQSVFQILGVSLEPALPEVLCLNCASLAANSFIFKKLCEYSEHQWETTIGSLDKIISEPRLTRKVTSVFLMIGEKEETMLTAKVPVNQTNKKALLFVAKRNMLKRLRYVKVEPEKKKVYKRRILKKQQITKDKEQVIKKKIQYPLPCSFCNKTFSTAQSLVDHKQRIHYEKKNKCGSCPNMFSSKTQLRRHRESKHASIMCRLCCEILPSKAKYEAHMNKCHFSSSCSKCGKKYTSRPLFVCHVKRCGIKDKFICDICGKVFAHKPTIQSHMIISHGFGDAMACRWCGKKFNCLSSIRGHEVKHTRERNFTCEICGGKFVTKPAIIYHRRLHTGEKPYKCDMCDERFINSSRRLTHMRKAHIGPQLQCDICSARFYIDSELKRHMKNHENRSRAYTSRTKTKPVLKKGINKVIVEDYNEY